VNMSELMRSKLESSLEDSIVNLIAKDYSTIAGKKPRQMLAKDIASLVSDNYKNMDRLEPGQALWLGVDVNDRPTYGRSRKRSRLLPVIITIWSKEDMDMRMEGYTNREIRENRIVRLFKEVYDQGAVFSNADVAMFVGVSPTTVSKQAREFMEKENIVLPTRGTIHDLGMATTHKRIIIKLYLSGYLTPKISNITNHSEEAIDRYIRAFEKVRLLKDKEIYYIHRATGMSPWLIKSYMEILNEWENQEDNK
jgi:hypothetical protein